MEHSNNQAYTFEDVEKIFIAYFGITKNKKKNEKYMELFFKSKTEELKNAETTKIITSETGFYFPDEVWDYILMFAGYQKISNYEEMLKIDLHILMKSYLHINKHQNRFVIDCNHAVLNKELSFKKNSKNIKKYIKLFYNKLLNNNSLKNTLIYFHIKLYVTFLSNYSHNAKEINLEIIHCKNKFYILYQEILLQSQQNIFDIYKRHTTIDWDKVMSITHVIDPDEPMFDTPIHF
jgi:hypothetical protein